MDDTNEDYEHHPAVKALILRWPNIDYRWSLDPDTGDWTITIKGPQEEVKQAIGTLALAALTADLAE